MANKKQGKTAEKKQKFVVNPHLLEMKDDFLYHLNLSRENDKIRERFHDVKFVCTGGSHVRMKTMADLLADELKCDIPYGCCLQNLSEEAHRFAMYKVGPVICVSHGMGDPSLSILLNEIIKLLYHADAQDPIIIRLGTSGGVGVDPGTVIISDSAYNGQLQTLHDVVVFGKVRTYPADLDKNLANELMETAKKMKIGSTLGGTMCARDFYEGQGRLDGAFCDYTEKDKLDFLKKLNSKGIRNIEMEASCFAALTKRAGIKAAIVCVALLNRLNGDQVDTPKDLYEDFQMRPLKLVAKFIKDRI